MTSYEEYFISTLAIILCSLVIGFLFGWLRGRMTGFQAGIDASSEIWCEALDIETDAEVEDDDVLDAREVE